MSTFRIAVLSAGLLVLSAAAPAAAAENTATATIVTGTIVESFGSPPALLEGSEVDRLIMFTEREVDWSDPRLPSRMVARTLLDSREGSRPEGAV